MKLLLCWHVVDILLFFYKLSQVLLRTKLKWPKFRNEVYPLEGRRLQFFHICTDPVPSNLKVRIRRFYLHICSVFQVMPQLLYFFGVRNQPDSLDWATIAVYTCQGSCDQSVSYKEEFAWVQLYPTTTTRR